jgi:predicted nucleotidyltransferase component of viral defense system
MGRTMPLNIATHKTILFQMLKDIYSDPQVAPFLGFKGGTAAVMFYGLDRFSVDLDFDLLNEMRQEIVFERIQTIVSTYGSMRVARVKRFSLFCLVSYEQRGRNIKVEVNRRQFGSSYEIKTYLGVSMLVITKPDMFAHKLMAMSERIGKTSRDIYDVWFFLKNRFPINKEIVEARSGIAFDSVLDKCIIQLENVNNRHILDGIGEFLSSRQKDWAKERLLQETIALLKLRKEN